MPRSTPRKTNRSAEPQALPFSPARLRALRRNLVAWHHANARVLPWRVDAADRGLRRPDPYAVLVSETMLQQTQVATVVAFFVRFMEQLPTIGDLANAEEQQVLKLWQGLGYYRRARNLHAAAKVVMTEHDGVMPQTLAGLLTLPGVGKYTAGAIASIAFGQRVPAVDGNVERVLSRLAAFDADMQSPRTKRQIEAWVNQLLDDKTSIPEPGHFNESLMELGATICTPRNPDCKACPVRKQCKAYEQGRVAELPRPKARKDPKAVKHTVLIVEKDGRYLAEQRPERGLWSNLWQFVTLQDEATNPGRWLENVYGLTVEALEDEHTFTHQTTHRTITFVVMKAVGVSGRKKPGRGVWLTLDEIKARPLAKPQSKVLAELSKSTLWS